jgi:hypothetical protein
MWNLFDSIGVSKKVLRNFLLAGIILIAGDNLLYFFVSPLSATAARDLSDMPLQQPQNSQDKESTLNCSEHNCILKNACIDYSAIKRRFVIRIIGNASHVQEIKTLAENATFKAYRESATFLFEGLQKNVTLAIAMNSTAAVINRAVSKNCGHDLGDEAWPVFRLMQLFSEPNPRLDDLYFLSRPPRYCDPVLEPIANRLIVQQAVTETKCYARLYFGTRGISYMLDHGTWKHRMTTLEADMRAFRSLYYRYANISSDSKLDTIVVMEKRQGKHMSNIGNRHEIVDFLKNTYLGYKVELVSWSDYSITEQVQLMSRTRVMISLPGSDVMNAIFLSDEGALLMFCRVVEEKNGNLHFDESNEMKHWFRHLSYMQASTEPCNSSAVSYNVTSDWGDTIVDLESLKERLSALGLSNRNASDLQTKSKYESSLVPQNILTSLSDAMEQSRRYLIEGSPHPCTVRRRKGDACVFQDISISLPIQKPLFYKLGEKTMVNPSIAFPQKDCIVYAMGIDNDSAFEQQMTQFCKQVHAFDCTVDLNSTSVVYQNFTFHQICIGSKTDIDDVEVYGHNKRSLTFEPLSTVMKELGHTQIDILKLDIEGSEYELFETEILSKNIPLPRQLLFELHTERADPRYVPPNTVRGKNRTEVNDLFLRLYDIGYRIVGMEINSGDGSCADFGMVLVDQ